ncbi:MAG: type IV pilus biogenesis/stability protein PilW [Halieaceae bacterium]|nr:type IV pilus biogenesis/stability protein PilW [Halieaceae bacterium]
MNLFRRLLPGLLLCGLVGCVTTEDRMFTGAVAPQQALESRLQLARGYVGKQNWDDARRNLKLAAEIDPDASQVHEVFALLYQGTGEYEFAEQSFRRALALNRNFSRARNNYAVFLYQQQRFEEAERQLEMVVEDTLYESRPRALLNLGLCRLRLQDQDGAHQAFIRTLTADRNNPAALMELAHIAFRRGHWDAGQRYYDGYRGLVSQQSARGLWLGLRLARQHRDAGAQSSYALALRDLYPESPEYRAYRQAVEYGEL